MADSTTDDSNSTASIDDLEIEMVDDGTENDSNDSTDDTQTGDDTDDLTSDDDSDEAEPKAAAKTDEKSPALDDDLEAWAEKKGYSKPETDRETKLLQDLRNSEREFTRQRQEAKSSKDLAKTIKDAAPESKKDDDTVDPLEKDVQELKTELRQERNTRMQSEYFNELDRQGKPITSEELSTMEEILKEEVAENGQEGFDYLTNPKNLRKWHILAKDRLAATSDDTAKAAEKARQDERQKLAKESKSGGPSRSAKSTVAAGKKDELTEMWEADD